MPLLSAAQKSKIKTIAFRLGLLKPINAIEYWYANRISSSVLAFYRPLIPDGSLAFDIGAHFGLKSRLFLELGARVVAVGPMPECAIQIRKLTEGSGKLTLFEGGCSDRIGTTDLHLCVIHPQNSTLSTEFRDNVEGIQSEAWRKLTVQTTTLDELITQHGVPVFCKIDTEGFEDRVLAGLSTKIPVLSFEFSLQRREILESCLNRLDQIGFKEFNFISGRLPSLNLAKWLPKNEFLRHLLEHPEIGDGDVMAR